MKTPAQWAKLHYDYGWSHPTTDKWSIEDFIKQIQDDAEKGKIINGMVCFMFGLGFGVVGMAALFALIHTFR